MIKQPFRLHTKHLEVGYSHIPVVSDIDFALHPGEILTIIGPNGSGKSTILKSLAKQLVPLQGFIYIEDLSLQKISETDLPKQVAVVLTERPQPELMTCTDVVAIGRYPYTGKLGLLREHDQNQIHKALMLVDAIELKDRYFLELSDGQKQRIMLARALCQEPDIIILDEPTSFLDIRYAVQILDILTRLAKEQQITIIISLHELSYAKRIADLVMCIKDGQVVHLAKPDAIFNEQIISNLYDLPPGLYHQIFGGL